MKQIKLSDTHYIVVDEWDGSDTESILYNEAVGSVKISKSSDIPVRELWKKITHSTQPLTFLDATGISTSNLKPSFVTAQEYPLSLAKEIAGEVDMEKLAESQYPIELWSEEESLVGRVAYNNGYNQCLEDNKDKKYTDEDIRKAIFLYSAWIVGGAPSLRIAESPEQRVDQIIQSLQPLTEWEVEIVEGKLKRK